MRLLKLTFCLLLLASCTQYKALLSGEQSDSKSKEAIRSHSTRLGIPVSQFLSENEVLIDGDMIFDPNVLTLSNGAFRIKSSSSVRVQGNILGFFWVNEVPIQFAPDVPRSMREMIKKSCEDFGVKCVCATHQTERISVDFDWPRCEGAAACANFPRGNFTYLHLNDQATFETVAHELGHSLGLVHEQQRFDRDTYIESIRDPLGFASNIRFEGTESGPFDYESIMLYPCFYRDANGNFTNPYVVLKDRSLCDRNGFLRKRVSAGDRAAAQAVRGATNLSDCMATTPPAEPIRSPPNSYGALNIIVRNKSTNEDVVGAIVTVGETSRRTDFTGVAPMRIPFGDYSASVRAEGFRTAVFPAFPFWSDELRIVQLEPGTDSRASPPPTVSPNPANDSGLTTVCIYYGGNPVPGVLINNAWTTDQNGCVSGPAPFGRLSLQFFYPGYPLKDEVIEHFEAGDRFLFRY